MTTTHSPLDLDTLTAEFVRDGFVVVSGLFSDDELDQLQASMEEVQRGVAEGTIDRARYGGDYLT